MASQPISQAAALDHAGALGVPARLDQKTPAAGATVSGASRSLLCHRLPLKRGRCR